VIAASSIIGSRPERAPRRPRRGQAPPARSSVVGAPTADGVPLRAIRVLHVVGGSVRDDEAQVIPLRRSHVADAAHALARAFAADAAFSSLWPHPATRARALRRLLAVPLADAVDHGHGEVLSVDRAVAGAAAWFPPGAYPMGLSRQLRALPQLLAVAAAAPRAFRRLSRFGSNVDAAFPDDRPWYLCVVGVVPEAQGRGLGTRLLRPGLGRCDASGGDCYLETDSAAAVRWYERLGFATIEAEARLLPDGPTHWRMRRRPAGRAPVA
jgi:ribosomal protein S18 acetylase RimI-like enzyme